MKKMISFLAAIMAVALFSLASASAADLYPRAEGNDVLVPDQLIRAIPGFDPTRPVYAATDVNGWFVRGSKFTSAKTMEATQMSLEEDGWRAKGLKGRRFHPVQLNADGAPKWALIEEVYELGSEFVDTSNKEGPCLLVK